MSRSLTVSYAPPVQSSMTADTPSAPGGCGEYATESRCELGASYQNPGCRSSIGPASTGAARKRMRRGWSRFGVVARCITQVHFERQKNADLVPELGATAPPAVRTEVDGEASARGTRKCGGNAPGTAKKLSGNPAIVGTFDTYPLDRWLCVPAFRSGLPLSESMTAFDRYVF